MCKFGVLNSKKYMNIKDFKREIEAMFPCRWGEDFMQDIKNVFAKYIDIVSCLDGVDTAGLDNVIHLCSSLMDVVNLYYDGRKGDAFMVFSAIMNGSADFEGLFNSIGCVDINPEEFYYRARERKIGEEYSILNMFHIPLNKRGIVSTQRYSRPGYPCLYLGNSAYACWEEMRRIPFDNLMFSAYKVKYPFKVFDMRVPSDSDYTSEVLVQTIKRIPLMLACSFTVKNTSDVFKPEYIIPQMLVETIISNNRKITQHEKSAIEPDVIWGVIYTSTHISSDFPYGKKYLENIVLPVIESNNPSHYCYCLASLFEISNPSCYEYESLKENTTRMFWMNIDQDQDKTEEEILRKQYDQTKMGYLEEKLKSAQFKTLDYLVVDCPSEGITLDSTGSPVCVKVRSSGPFTIE
jgi:hypothetical protein